ncbi:MAG TPA: LysR family transcriptional regulator [Castellaniella sp.]|uniref:LysR family transcriptional regulator n=1 Tax=Castellaniella sp. TaxID=1955812 RepID=UPI002F1D23EC
MEIRQLEAFSAVVTSGNVSSAARVLGRSQPVVSRQVGDLEAELGFVLFERTRPTITLTSQGAGFYQEVRGVLVDLQQLELRARDMRSGSVQPMRILAAADLARTLLCGVLADMNQAGDAYRQRVVVDEVVHETTASDVMESQADFALISLPIAGDDLQVHWCGQAPCQLAMPTWHRLAARESIGLNDIVDTDVITLLGRYRMRYHLTHGLVGATSGSQRRHIEAGSQQTALAMVRAGLGVALMDPFSSHGVTLEGIVMRPMLVDIPYRIGVVSQRSRELPDDVQRLIKRLHQQVVSTIPRYIDTDANGLPVR